MASKAQSPGPNPGTSQLGKQARSRKVANPGPASQTDAGRSGSAGGVVLEKAQGSKNIEPLGSTAKAATTSGASDTAAPAGAARPRRKPRKLNKEPTSTGATSTENTPAAKPVPETSSELEALKARVRGLEAKVEELYKAGVGLDARPGRSPRRRGKGRKGSSSAQVPTLSTLNTPTAKVEEVDDAEEEADEELVRLEGELEVARQDLELYQPRNRRAFSQDTDDVEEIPREKISSTETKTASDRQVTLSGSYRIPIPANVSVEDVKTIKSGVSAAQNVARSFLEQRRAAAALREQQTPAPAASASSSTRATRAPRPKPTTNSSMEIAVDDSTGKQSWSDWIGGYSMAITRAVKTIEHEAAMESQRAGSGSGSGSGSASGTGRPATGVRRGSAPTSKKAAGKRPPAKATLSSEQAHGLMS